MQLLDTAATIVSGNTFTVGDIAPGQVRLSSVTRIRFSPWCSGERDIVMELVFSSSSVDYWCDTISFRVTNPLNVPEQEESPTAFALEQNYPNPFNPATTVEFRIQSSEFVSLSVYDLLGREVATLVNEVKQPGVYTVQWDASEVSSGLYIYRLVAGDPSTSLSRDLGTVSLSNGSGQVFVSVKKMLLLR